MMALPPDVTRPALVARALARWMGDAADRSPFLRAAAEYAHRPVGELEEVSGSPTGYDPGWAALFEATLELAFLVLRAEGPLTTEAKGAFSSAIVGAVVPRRHEMDLVMYPEQVDALLADVEEQLAEDGAEKRTRMVARTITHADHQREALRIAAMMAQLLGPPSAPTRQALEGFARAFGLDRTAADEALREAERSLADASG